MIYDRQGDKMTSRNTEQSMADESRQNIEQAKRGVKQGKDIAKKIDNYGKNKAGNAADKANSSTVNPAKKAKENLAKYRKESLQKRCRRSWETSWKASC